MILLAHQDQASSLQFTSIRMQIIRNTYCSHFHRKGCLADHSFFLHTRGQFPLLLRRSLHVAHLGKMTGKMTSQDSCRSIKYPDLRVLQARQCGKTAQLFQDCHCVKIGRHSLPHSPVYTRTGQDLVELRKYKKGDQPKASLSCTTLDIHSVILPSHLQAIIKLLLSYHPSLIPFYQNAQSPSLSKCDPSSSSPPASWLSAKARLPSPSPSAR